MPQNVVLLTVDSLRAERFLSSRARDALTSLDRLADSPGGTRFSAAFATGPGTTPSFPGILTGTYPLSMGGFEPLDDRRPFLAATLSDAGFATGSFTSNPFLSASFNYDTGFDEFVDYQNPLMGIATRLFPRGIESPTPFLQRFDDYLHFTTALRKGYELLAGKSRPYVAADVVTDDVIGWIRQTDSPFFCWGHYMDVHHPCYPPAQYRDAFDVPPTVSADDVAALYSTFVSSPSELSDADLTLLERLYDAAIAFTDDQINRVLDVLDETGFAEETVVIVTSDHGELFGEHDAYAKPERLYDELLHVPLVASNLPPSLSAAHDQLVSLVDLPSIVHHALSLPPRTDDGRVPGVDDPRDYVLAEHKRGDDVIVGARGQSYRFAVDHIRDVERAYSVPSVDTATTETRIDPADEPPEVDPLRTAVYDRLREIDIASPSVSLDDDVEQRLADLGYR
ncbi:sulfatase [Halonotius aquaticus]|uniref:Sulfatase n=1 Tax=Halonotius aquaticus TaxID=2216978 RepID=A0A3A6PYQ4_9EURY|nr:sulfatase [Halonotius aquaticus]RJX43373.1 sulfatase [Halonotius aquaticus]